jgi:hypothetical protein
MASLEHDAEPQAFSDQRDLEPCYTLHERLLLTTHMSIERLPHSAERDGDFSGKVYEDP